MRVELPTLAATERFGQALALAFGERSKPPALLLFGDLGAGKTTLIRCLVECLPGANESEVTSPSFNLVNLYPTTPPVAHFDLYRLEKGFSDDEIFEYLDAKNTWKVIEWAEKLDSEDIPQGAMTLHFQLSGTGRTLEIQAKERADERALSSALTAIEEKQ